ncbi:hypothetical protein ACVJGD_008576 [Bradyrhizobium sp. USDA 10063]
MKAKIPPKSNRGRLPFWTAASHSFLNGASILAVTSGVLCFLLVAKRYL